MSTSVCQFNVRKNGRPVSARNFQPVVLCPIFSCASGPSASLLSSRSPLRRRSWPLTWRGRRGDQAIERRRSNPLLLSGHDAKEPAGRNGAELIRCFSAKIDKRAPENRRGVAEAVAVEAGMEGFKRLAVDDCFGFLAGCFHFLFLFWPGVGLVLFSTNTIPNRLAIVNHQKAKNMRFFIGRNRRHLRRAVARTQNPAVEGRREPTTNPKEG